MPDREDPPRAQRTVEPEILGPETVVHDHVDFRMDFADPTSQGEVVTRDARAQTPPTLRSGAAQVPGGAPLGGNLAMPADLREVDAGTMAAVGAASAEFLAGLEAMGHVEDDVSDEQALALAGRAHQARLAQVRAPQVAAPAEPVLFLPGEVPPRPPQTLPAILNHTPAVRDEDWQGQGLPAVAWLQVYDTPGYLQQMIRAFGREIFRTFPCYAAHERELRGRGDALGSLHLIANLGGGGPSRQTDLDQAAQWVAANGVAVDATTFRFPHMPGYEPRIVLAVDADQSYLLVQERGEWGAPADSMYVYSWPGGAKFYGNNLPARDAVAGRIGGRHDGVAPPPPRALPGPGARVMGGMREAMGAAMRGGRMPVGYGGGHGGGRPDMGFGGRQAAAPQAPRQRALPPMAPPAAPRNAADLDALRTAPVVSEATRRERDARRPVAQQAAVTSNVTAALKAAGFRMKGTPNGPVLHKVLDDGSQALVSSAQGMPLAQSTAFELVLQDEAGVVTARHPVTGADEVEALLPGTSPRP